MNEKISIGIRGFAMGIAEVIPGVSGGTIAFITGIYHRLLSAIGHFDLGLMATFKQDGLGKTWEKIDGTFLVSLLGGMAVGVVFGIFTITHLMETHPEPLWGFFFGLIIASAIVLFKELKAVTLPVIISLIAGAVVAYIITVVSPTEGTTNLFYVYISGAIAICALMLPGISGSFVLLLMGMYTIIIPTLKSVLTTFDGGAIVICAVFALGLLTGLLSFAKVLSWLFDHYNQITFAAMIGFLIGSLNKIWPWRNVTQIADKESGVISSVTDYQQLFSLDKETYKVLSEHNVLPSNYLMHEPRTILTIIAILVGLGVVLVITKLDTSNK